MNESEYEDLLATAVRRGLTASEQARLAAWLADRPAARDDWVMDERLIRCLRRLPDIPLPTNFTACVMHKVGRLAAGHRPRRLPTWLRWLPGLGHGWRLASALGAIALVVAVHYQQARQRAELTLSLQALPAASLAEVDLWRDFESINTLPAGPVPSVDQLAEAFK